MISGATWQLCRRPIGAVVFLPHWLGWLRGWLQPLVVQEMKKLQADAKALAFDPLGQIVNILTQSWLLPPLPLPILSSVFPGPWNFAGHGR